MKKNNLLVFVGIFLAIVLFIPSSTSTTLAQDSEIPAWIKNNAGWWATDQIDDSSFLQGIQYLVKEGIMIIPSTEMSDSSGSEGVPDWVKNTAGWWANNMIPDDDFVSSIQYLMKIGVIIIPQTENVLTNIPTIKSFDNILDTTLFFEVEVEHLCDDISVCPEDYKTLNSEGFRGQEFSKVKPDDTYRIITVGGSTTFSVGVTEENAWPRILEKKLQNLSEGKNIEVINAGIPGMNSFGESKLLKSKLIQFEPDLVIVYDGFNDTSCKMDEHIIKTHVRSIEVLINNCGVYSPDNYDKIYAERWSGLCEVGEKNGFETVLIIQPMVSFGKILTDEEHYQYFVRPEQPHYLNVLESFAAQLNNIEKNCAKTADFRGIFDNYLQPIYFDYAHVGDMGNEILAGNVLELISPILHEKGITKLITTQPNTIKPIQDPEVILQLYEANWGEILPNQKNFIAKNLSGKDFSNSNLENKIFFGSDLRNANFENSTLSGSDFSLANLENANFKNAVIDGIKLRQTILDQTDFSNVDFRQVNLTHVDLTNAILKNSILSNKDLTKTFLYNSDLSGADLSNSNLSLLYLKNTVLKNVNLHETELYEVDLSLIRDKDLSGATLTGAAMTWSNLTGVDFSGRDLSDAIFRNSDLSGQDFTNNVTFFSNDFIGADLSNADFEGVDLSPHEIFHHIFYDLGYLSAQPPNVILEAICEIHTYFCNTPVFDSVEIANENDLLIGIIFRNHFGHTNLENTNFKNADLKYASFFSADLVNADLSGADLRYADFSNADLSNANLNGAILDEAVLSCKNHSVCD